MIDYKKLILGVLVSGLAAASHYLSSVPTPVAATIAGLLTLVATALPSFLGATSASKFVPPMTVLCGLVAFSVMGCTKQQGTILGTAVVTIAGDVCTELADAGVDSELVELACLVEGVVVPVIMPREQWNAAKLTKSHPVKK